jgi:SEC-C motif-containing protein
VAKTSAPKPKDCPCSSGARYSACCAPLHSRAREAETPEALMRSRFSAFALGDGGYLVDTLASDHEDRALPRAELVQRLSRLRERQRFLKLTVLEAPPPSPDGRDGEVLFHARIFQGGVDVSFTERSRFVREGDAWRYADGELVPGTEHSC